MLAVLPCPYRQIILLFPILQNLFTAQDPVCENKRETKTRLMSKSISHRTAHIYNQIAEQIYILNPLANNVVQKKEVKMERT